MNSARLIALVLFAVGIAIFAYLLADQGALRRPPMASTIAWTGGFVLLAFDSRTRRPETTPERASAPRSVSAKVPVPSHRHVTGRKPPRSADHRHTSSAAEYTHQTSHF
jgi:hypothetical protein